MHCCQLTVWDCDCVCQIWGSEAGVEASPGDLVMKNQRNWGPVNNVIVTLLNPDEEVTHTYWPPRPSLLAQST